MSFEGRLGDDATLRELGERLARTRLQRGATQATLAREAGVSKRTLERIEAGRGGQVTSLIRVLRALGLLGGLEALVPAPGPSPMELLARRGAERKRAPRTRAPGAGAAWTWGDERAEPGEDPR